MMRRAMWLGLAAFIVLFAARPGGAAGQDAGSSPHYKAFVDMKTFMAHVLTPAASVVWSVNGVLIDASGEHDLSPKSDADWEAIVSGAATLAEATNALRLPERARDAQWDFYALKLADAADTAYQAAEAHDLKTISGVSDRLDGVCAACHQHYGLE